MRDDPAQENTGVSTIIPRHPEHSRTDFSQSGKAAATGGSTILDLLCFSTDELILTGLLAAAGEWKGYVNSSDLRDRAPENFNYLIKKNTALNSKSIFGTVLYCLILTSHMSYTSKSE